MRVLTVANSFPPVGHTGGAEVSNYHTCRGLIQQGVDCSVLVLNNRVSELVNEWYELDGIPVHRMTHPLARHAITDVFDPWIYKVTRAELRRLKPDLVHIHNVSGATLAPYLACRTMGVPVVNTLHDLWLLCPNNMLYRTDGSFCDPRQNSPRCRSCFRHYDFWGNIPHRRRVFAALTSNVRVFVSPSQALVDRHLEVGYAAERFRVIPYGFKPPVAEGFSSRRFTEMLQLVSGYRTIVFAGGGNENKGATVLLQALPDLFKRVNGLRVMVAGGGEQRILAQFRQYAPAVQVLGVVPFADMRTLFALADLTLVASVCHENSPVVIYESFQAGTPVVGSQFGGIPELIRVNETGHLFAVGAPAAMAEAIAAHFSRPPLHRRRMRQRCVKEVRTRLTLKNYIQRLKKVYQQAWNGS
jgi:glycosyltransferase involved in cell wall biosynthesis